MSTIHATAQTATPTLAEPTTTPIGSTLLLQPAVMVIFGATGDLTAPQAPARAFRA